MQAFQSGKKCLQNKIENLTMEFDETSIRKSSCVIMQKMISDDKPSAKDFLMEKLNVEKNVQYEFLNDFGQYTLEALIIYVICLLYRSDLSMVRVATLIDHLERYVYSHMELVYVETRNQMRIDPSIIQSRQIKEREQLAKEKLEKKKKKAAKDFSITGKLIELQASR